MAEKQTTAPRTAMPCQDPAERATNFREVALGYDEALAMAEARRCLKCKKPLCRQGCPVEIDIKGFIAALLDEGVAAAHKVIRETNALPAVCGRVCPQETQCEGACVLGKKHEPVAIGRLERYVADAYHASDACESLTGEHACAAPTGARAAVVGAGPAGLTCAGYLAARGVEVTVFEALHEPGGVLVYGIPEFRLPGAVVAREVEALRALGVAFEVNHVGGRTFSIAELFEQGFGAVFLGVGAGLPRFLGVPGENLVGVFSANEYLTRVNLGRAYEFPEHDTPAPDARRCVVVGGGNVAMDAARTAKRMGADEVRILYRRGRDEMPARLEEVEHAVEEGIVLECLCGPVSFNPGEDGRLASVTVQRMCLGEPDASGRRSPVCIEGETMDVPCDLAVVAVGTMPNPVLLASEPELARTPRGYLDCDPDTGETSMANVFAGGDIVTGSATVISAMGAGRRAAKAMAGRLLG